MNLQRLLIPIALSVTALLLTLSSAQAGIPQTPIENLKSDRLLDYGPLQDLLRAGNWEEANAVTSTLMLKAGGQLERGYLVEHDIHYFPCNDLLTVNRLWQYYSNDRYGYGPQTRIWVALKGKTYQDSLRFEKKVGWGNGKSVIANPAQAPVGHLPFRPASGGGVPDAWGGWWIREMPRRLNTCMNPVKPKPIVKAKPQKTPQNVKLTPRPPKK
jgi:GUN4-like